ncbi:lysophospholipid acyltransferase family protein [Chloroflexota bacterium]
MTKMSLAQVVVAGFLRTLTACMFRVDASELKKVPAHGPLIIIANHVHIPEIPTLYTRLLPRKVHGMVMAEHVENRHKIVGRILNLFGSIPVHRGELDLPAIRQGLQILKNGRILLIDPEGTRSHDGCLGKGRPGAILLALRSEAPLLPVVHFGSEGYRANRSRFHRTNLTFKVGVPFYLRKPSGSLTQALRRQITDEVMFQMALLLPERYRGAYSDLGSATQNYLEFDMEH